MKPALGALFVTVLWTTCGAATQGSILGAHNAAGAAGVARVAGGAQAARGQFPWHVTIITDEFGFCNGALLDAQWVLTSGRCAHGVTNFMLTLGTASIADLGDNDTVTIATTTKYVHPLFDERTLLNDVALLKFETPLNLSDSAGAFIAPIRLSSQADLGDVDGVEVLLSGWGMISETAPSPISSQLMYDNLTVTPLPACRAAFGMANVHDGMLCTSGEGKRGACAGDEGAPLVAWTGTSWEHVGVASFAAARGCEQGAPTVYARTSSYAQWIADTRFPPAPITTPAPGTSSRRACDTIAIVLPALMAVLSVLRQWY